MAPIRETQNQQNIAAQAAEPTLFDRSVALQDAQRATQRAHDNMAAVLRQQQAAASASRDKPSGGEQAGKTPRPLDDLALDRARLQQTALPSTSAATAAPAVRQLREEDDAAQGV